MIFTNNQPVSTRGYHHEDEGESQAGPAPLTLARTFRAGRSEETIYSGEDHPAGLPASTSLLFLALAAAPLRCLEPNRAPGPPRTKQAQRRLPRQARWPRGRLPPLPCKLATVFCSSRSLRSSSAAFLSSSSCCRSRLACAAEATAWGAQRVGAAGHGRQRDSVSLSRKPEGPCPMQGEPIPAPRCLGYQRPPQRRQGDLSPTTPLSS